MFVILCAVQDVPGLAEGCVQLLMPQLTGEPHQPRAVVLPAHVKANPAFEALEQSVAIGSPVTRR